MQGMLNTYCFHIPGTLTANIDIRWTAARRGRIKEISAVASNDSDATLAAGDSGDTDEYLVAAAIGDSQVPTVFTRSNWASTNPTAAFAEGDVIVLTLDYDGSSGTAGQNVTIVVTTLEG
jgi:hypothetical protein